MTQRAALVIVDAVPYAAAPRESAFSAAFTFLHSHFMGRQLLSEDLWRRKLTAAIALMRIVPNLLLRAYDLRDRLIFGASTR